MSDKSAGHGKLWNQLEEARRFLGKLSGDNKRQVFIAFLMKRGWSRSAAGHRAGLWGLK